MLLQASYDERARLRDKAYAPSSTGGRPTVKSQGARMEFRRVLARIKTLRSNIKDARRGIMYDVITGKLSAHHELTVHVID